MGERPLLPIRSRTCTSLSNDLQLGRELQWTQPWRVCDVKEHDDRGDPASSVSECALDAGLSPVKRQACKDAREFNEPPSDRQGLPEAEAKMSGSAWPEGKVRRVHGQVKDEVGEYGESHHQGDRPPGAQEKCPVQNRPHHAHS